MKLDVDRQIARIPRLIVVLGVVGTGIAGLFGGLPYAGAFFIGAGAAYFNFKLVERVVTGLTQRVASLATTAPADLPKSHKLFGVRLAIQFGLFVLGTFVILRLSGFNVVLALFGFFVCPAAVMLEILYELITYGHS
jgi:uncharacterized membrane protein YuzA (DUF378 family)